MPKYLLVDHNGENVDAIFNTAFDAEEHLEKEVRDGNVSADAAENWGAYEVNAANMEVEVTVKVTIS